MNDSINLTLALKSYSVPSRCEHSRFLTTVDFFRTVLKWICFTPSSIMEYAVRIRGRAKRTSLTDFPEHIVEELIAFSVEALGLQASELSVGRLEDFQGTNNSGGRKGEKVSSVGAVLVVARAYMLMKQTPKAKALLKRVVGHQWTLEEADYLEKCWLLLADLYINQNKSEQANMILRTVLQHNASSIKAFEFLGYLREREQKFNDAAANYDDAWKLSRMRNPSIGYKLAYNLLKCKRLFDCIEVCHHVLKLYPTYPKIKKEIMDKARMSIRS
ncbi:hypothetical protein Y032_0137g2024 [Ancylostoma ceylanicum]|uniref:Tetratricopeptide repeat protein 21A/21B C-terminal ARM domain-containing protein n=2 Tax=Ancylostoma ceylanicum TaxID=53326 RepID=A0A016T4Y8_9BILA|nr:hypothetical protein Y032_0137g2024 [Ancylostoma ceylanicum]